MADPYLGEIKMWSISFAPRGWALCQGQLMSVPQNSALFSLLGTYFGGNGQTTFGLPDLRGRTMAGGNGNSNQGLGPVGTLAGVENVTIDQTTAPLHTHYVNGTSVNGTLPAPGGPGGAADFATVVSARSGSMTNFASYAPGPNPTIAVNAGTISTTGGNQPHTNLQPFSVLNFTIATSGVYPSRQ